MRQRNPYRVADPRWQKGQTLLEHTNVFRVVNSARLHWFAAFAMVDLVAMMGCGESVPKDADELNITIANLSDAAADPDAFQSFFVDGSAPNKSKRHRYRDYFYEMSPPEISGNAATAFVRIVDSTGKIVDTKTWTFSRVGTKWKIRAAPLP